MMMLPSPMRIFGFDVNEGLSGSACAMFSVNKDGAGVDSGRDSWVAHLRARHDVAGQLLVAHRDVVLVSVQCVVGVDGHLAPSLHQDGLAPLEHARADLGSFGVQKHRAHQPGGEHRLTQRVQGALVVLVGAVREVEARDGHTRAEQVLHDGELRALRAERAHNLRGRDGIP